MNNDAPLILVIDDDALLSRSIAEKLTNVGYRVETALNGTDGMKKALELQPSLIFLDYQMPDMNGMQVLSKIREDEWGAKVEVIFATNTYDMAVINEAMSMGIHNYILKAETSLEQIADLARKHVPLKA
jgi:CheY-like chemotaxis protein